MTDCYELGHCYIDDVCGLCGHWDKQPLATMLVTMLLCIVVYIGLAALIAT